MYYIKSLPFAVQKAIEARLDVVEGKQPYYRLIISNQRRRTCTK
jgi:hypothetical protein